MDVPGFLASSGQATAGGSPHGASHAARPGLASGSGSQSGLGSASGILGGSGSPSGSGPGGGLDLSPFLERLRRSAAECATRRRHALGSVAEVRFCVGRDGAPNSASLVESSGYADLDRAALDCVVPRAAPFPPIDRCLVVPLRFQ
ncbi:MAG: energy transducer TonB [Myxococcales bacterium]